MRHLVFRVTALAVVCLLVSPAWAEAQEDRSERPGFNFGGAPEDDSPPFARDDQEKQALAALYEMTQGQWHLSVAAREGRVPRQLTAGMVAKRVLEIGTSSGYST